MALSMQNSTCGELLPPFIRFILHRVLEAPEFLRLDIVNVLATARQHMNQPKGEHDAHIDRRGR